MTQQRGHRLLRFSSKCQSLRVSTTKKVDAAADAASVAHRADAGRNARHPTVAAMSSRDDGPMKIARIDVETLSTYGRLTGAI